jgi:hypothetical protein
MMAISREVDLLPIIPRKKIVIFVGNVNLVAQLNHN